MKTTLRALTLSIAVGALSLGAITTAPAHAQEAKAPAQQQSERMRNALNDRLAELRQRQQEMESLLSRLDAGEPTDDLRDAVRDAMAAGGRRHADRAGERPGRDNAEGLLRILGEVDPEMRDRIRRAVEEDPEHARRMFQRVSPRLREMADMHDRDPEKFRAKMQFLRASRESFDIARRLDQAKRDAAGEAEIGRLRAELLESVAGRVDLEAQQRREAIEGMSKRLDALKSELDESLAEREATIVRQAQRLEEAAGRQQERERGEGRPMMRRGRPGHEGGENAPGPRREGAPGARDRR